MNRNMWALRCFVFAAALSTGQWMLAQGTPPGRTIRLHPTRLIDLALKPSVQTELRIATDAAKIEQLSQLYDAARHEMASSLRAVNRRDFRKQSHEIEQKLQAKYKVELKKLLTPEQFSRLEQINWQRERAAALEDPDVIQALDVTKDQQTKLAALRDETESQTFTLLNPGGTPARRSEPGVGAKTRELMSDREKKAIAILSPAQQEKFSRLKGTPFDLALLRARPVLRTGETGLVIDIKDPGIQVAVRGGLGVSVASAGGPHKSEVRIEPGDHQLAIMTIAGPRQFITKDSFSLQKGQKRNVAVSIVDNQVVVKLDNQPVSLTLKTGPTRSQTK